MRTYYPTCHAVLQVVLDGFGDVSSDTKTQVFPVRPISATIHKNSYRQPDSWELTFSANEFPFDPNLMRSGAVEIYLYHTDGLTDPFEYRSQKTRTTSETSKGSAGAKQLTPQVAGLIQNITASYTDSDRTISVSGEDYTALLLALQFPPKSNGYPQRIPTNERVDKLIKRYVKAADPNLLFETRDIDVTELTVVSKYDVRSNKRGIPIKADTSYWDVIYGLAIRSGLIAYVDGVTVVLTRAKSPSKQNSKRPLQLAYGRNISSIELSRDMGKTKTPNIIVKSYSEKDKRTISVEYPTKRQSTKVGKRTAKNEYTIVHLHGVSNRRALLRHAETIYNLYGRAETQVRLVTRDLKDLGATDGDGNDFAPLDMLDVKPGDPAKIVFDEFNVNRSLLVDSKVPFERKYSTLVNLGYSQQVANVLAAQYTKLQALSRAMRVREISFDWSVTDGISIEAELVDYVVLDNARVGANQTPASEQRNNKYG